MTTHAPYHHGSRAVQDLVGVRELADHVGRSIGDGIRPVAAAFLELQPMLVIGGADPAGAAWASLLTGEPGFLRATGPRQMSIAGGACTGPTPSRRPSPRKAPPWAPSPWTPAPAAACA